MSGAGSHHTGDEVLRGSSSNSIDEVNDPCERGSKQFEFEPLGSGFDMDKEAGDDLDKDDPDASRIRKRPRKEANAVEHEIISLKNHLLVDKSKSVDVETSKIENSFQSSQEGDSESSVSSCKLIQTKIRKALVLWLIADDIPFKTADNPAFKFFMSVACPMFMIPSRRIINRDLYNLFIEKRNSVDDFITNHSKRICITINTCTSIQRVNYLCLTAQFIDDDWNLHRRILNFCPISRDKSEEMGKWVRKCLLDWGFDSIFTVTTNNDSSSDAVVTYLIKTLDDWGTNLLDGKYVHIRCIAHIVNLIVQDGLKNKEEHLAVSRIRGAVRYVLQSPARYERFQECVAVKNLKSLETDRLLSLDVPSKWDSTYIMLESATCLKEAFDAYEDLDLDYKNDLSKPPYDGPPTDYDWKRAELLLKFLRHFYELTKYIFGPSPVTSINVFHQGVETEMLLRDYLESVDLELSEMSRRMKENFDKYWGSIENKNMILCFAVVLDPRSKLKFLDFLLDTLYEDSEKSMVMKDKVKCGLQELFGVYKLRYDSQTCANPVNSASAALISGAGSEGCVYRLLREHIRKQMAKNVKTELEKYIDDDIEDDHKTFDILDWWKVNGHRFPVLSQIARDVFAVPVSRVATEAIFNTEECVLDSFRSSLSPKIVEALICCQDWLRMDPNSITVEELSSSYSDYLIKS